MAVGDYTTLARVKADKDITSSTDDAVLEDKISAASRMVENYCGRFFYEVARTLVFDYNGPEMYGGRLYPGIDILAVSKFTNGGEGDLVEGTSFRLYPRNASPKWAIDLIGNRTFQTNADNTSEDALVLWATEGYCTDAGRPEDITLATTKLSLWLYENRDNNDPVVQFADGTRAIPSQAPDIVFKLLDKYVRMGFVA